MGLDMMIRIQLETEAAVKHTTRDLGERLPILRTSIVR
jgi:hypothetical protein